MPDPFDTLPSVENAPREMTPDEFSSRLPQQKPYSQASDNTLDALLARYAGASPNFTRDVGRGLSGAAYTVAGAPTDITHQFLSGAAQLGGGQPLPEPVGGSEWLRRKAEEYGIAKERTGSAAEQTADFIGQMADPMALVAKLGTFGKIAGTATATLLPVAVTEDRFKKAVDLAKNLKSSNASPDEIWKTVSERYGVGIVYDPVNKGFRAELSDHDFMLNPEFKNGMQDVTRFRDENGRWPTVGEVWSHPGLEQIPELWKPVSELEMRQVAGTKIAGEYRSPRDVPGGSGMIRLNPALRNKPGVNPFAMSDKAAANYRPGAKDVMIHELQHAIDEFGGGVRGTNPTAAEGMQNYLRNISEAVARGTENRTGMSSGERALMPIYMSMETPFEDALNNPMPYRYGPIESEGATREGANGKTMHVFHWSDADDLEHLDPKHYGTGIRGAENNRVLRWKEMGLPSTPARTYVYDSPKAREPGLGPHQYQMRVENMYDANKDPLNLLDKAEEHRDVKLPYGGIDMDARNNVFEREVKKAGFSGIHYPNSGAAILFNKTPVERVGGSLSVFKEGTPTLDEAHEVFPALQEAHQAMGVTDKPGENVVNVGLNVNDGSTLKPAQVRKVLKSYGVDILKHEVRTSATEPTLVASLSRPLTAEEANDAAIKLKQEAIAQRTPDGGALHGPGADKWGPFNPDYFLDHATGVERAIQREPEMAPTHDFLKSNLLPDEYQRLTPQGLRAIHGIMQDVEAGKVASAQDIAAMASAGQVKKGWYENSGKALAHVFGKDSPRFAALLAALSPQTSVEANLTNALNVWKGWVNAGRPTDEATLMRIMGENVQGEKGEGSVLGAWRNNSISALTHPDPANMQLSGPKVNGFAANLRGVMNEVTNDSWQAQALGVAQSIFSGSTREGELVAGKSPGYLAANALTRKAAEILTKHTGVSWSPAEVQETMWSFVKAAMEGRANPMMGDTVREVIKGLTPHDIAGTPDFSTLLHNPEYADILKGSGYGPQLESLHSQGLAFDPAAAGNARAYGKRRLGAIAARLERQYLTEPEVLKRRKPGKKGDLTPDDVEFSEGGSVGEDLPEITVVKPPNQKITRPPVPPMAPIPKRAYGKKGYAPSGPVIWQTPNQ